MKLPKFELENDLEKKLYEFLQALNVAVQEKQDRIEDKLSPAMKKARELMRKDPYYSLFHIPSESFHNNKKDWNSFLGQRFEKMIGLILEDYIADPLPEGFLLKQNKQLCDYSVIFDNKKYAIEVKNRFGTAERKVHDAYLGMYDKIKLIEEGSWIPLFLIRMTDNNATAIKKWTKKGWIIKQGNETNDFIKKYTGFDLNFYLNKIELPRIRKTPDMDGTLNEYLKE